MKGFILAAGFGTRLQPITLSIPKPLIPIFNTNGLLLSYSRLHSLNLSNIYVNVHYLPEQITSYVKNNNLKISVSFENEILGVGGGIGKLKNDFNNEDVIVHNADIISNIPIQKLIDQHLKNKNWATLALIKTHTDKDGVLFDSENNITSFSSKNHSDAYTFTGISIISNEIYQRLPSDKFYNIIDLYNDIIKSDNFDKIKSCLFEQSFFWFDMGALSSYWDLYNLISKNSKIADYFKISNSEIEKFKNNLNIYIESDFNEAPLTSESIIFKNKCVWNKNIN